ncbi:hypothetical protein V3C99_001648 [Haemonchus contortus]|uniref:RT_RNaseH_2 domain-containing protein n=1 Tax=Haemonchus contortus TaxID=6289 RepID=A0A7I4YB15_HAECO
MLDEGEMCEPDGKEIETPLVATVKSLKKPILERQSVSGIKEAHKCTAEMDHNGTDNCIASLVQDQMGPQIGVRSGRNSSSSAIRLEMGSASTGFSKQAGCLFNLTSAKAKWAWNQEHERAFEKVKSMICSAPVLAQPDIEAERRGDRPFVICTDASMAVVRRCSARWTKDIYCSCALMDALKAQR